MRKPYEFPVVGLSAEDGVLLSRIISACYAASENHQRSVRERLISRIIYAWLRGFRDANRPPVKR
ncbi:hypothetical protein SAMN05892883_2092 [Jatrophihabitans sp. GAS493]|nr:hypothetical protein SAMN05892883_2092 [Jatrophihabitans sp. GAS493]